jgi:hypothetical protein
LPTYSEIYENVLDRVERKVAESKTLADREAFAQDIMDALAEAWHLGSNSGMKLVASLLTSDTVPELEPNPYEKVPCV